ncbi:GntR family transcriptional regulator [Nonomuraea sp. CA-218870]|uniref:winged helix-turn-helix domain-containing protein n=1 Tax=Nonomuraea sp. CA-218870 TaxID=3239998 RepID=UPI003D944CA0
MFDPEGDSPLYQQVSEVLRLRLAQSSPGAPVPSEAQIQHEFGVARTTARRAIRILRDAGLVHTIQGRGTFVGAYTGIPAKPGNSSKYRQIADELVQHILEGRYRPTRPVPSETALIQHYDVARETVRRALATLREEGWIYTVPQRGSYVAAEERWPTTRNDNQTTVVESATSHAPARQ